MIAVLALAMTACGGDDRSPSRREGSAKPTPRMKATLVLDFLPNAVHAGIFRAAAAGYYEAADIDLRIVQPTSTADTLKLIDAGKADFGIADAIDVMGQIDAGRDAQAFMAIVQRPLGGVITRRRDRIADPRQLEGQKVGITGVPSDTAILDTAVLNAGGDPAKVEKITIGFNGAQNLESGKLKAFVGYYPADGIQVEAGGTPVTVFKFDESGGFAYPGLVAFSTRSRIASDAALVKAFAAATVHGYEDAIEDPARALSDLLAQNRALKRTVTGAQLEAYEPLFKARARAYGVIDAAEITRLSSFLVDRKLIGQPVAADRFSTDRLVEQR